MRQTVMTVGATALALATGFAGGRATLASAEARAASTAHVPTADAIPAVQTGSYSAIVDRTSPAVVTVRVDGRRATPNAAPDSLREFFGPQVPVVPDPRRQRGLGSGVVIRSDGYVLTNHHVVAEADRIRVDLADGRTFDATLVGSDPASDVAVLRIGTRDLPTLAFGDSDRVKVGDVVLAFGNPLGVGQTVTMGIVSAKGRATGLGDGSYEDFLQTDAPINEGHSGGALVNVRGELVGINAQILSPTGGNIGLGFAIPSGMAHAVSDQLIRDGVVHRSKLGVTVQAVTPELAGSLGLHEARGALVSDIEPGGPAARAGLRQGDVIAELDGHPVNDANALRNQIAGTRPGTSMSITVLRGGRTESVSVRLVEREPSRQANAGPQNGPARGEPAFGMTVVPVTPQIAGELDLPRTKSGLAVTGVDPAGAAASAGLQAGDVIERVNGGDVTSVADLRAALTERTDRPALVLVNRHGASAFVALARPRS
ncbi:MAG: Do family serine endopeptidase [Acidobacteria bacterium]|nr:Do family serine endopeptidase [Acidobacteriota bacterium]